MRTIAQPLPGCEEVRDETFTRRRRCIAGCSVEANIFDQRADQTYATGGIVHFAVVAKPVKAGGRWNTYEITAKGPEVVVVLNGVETTRLEHGQFAQGPIALQFGNLPPKGDPGGAIKFRKVQVKPL